MDLLLTPPGRPDLLLRERFPWFQDPGPILAQILERFFPQLLVPGRPRDSFGLGWARTEFSDNFVHVATRNETKVVLLLDVPAWSVAA